MSEKVIKLIKDEELNLENSTFTRLMGGFDNEGIVISDLQIGELLGV